MALFVIAASANRSATTKPSRQRMMLAGDTDLPISRPVVLR
jgi:hypothetical protein